MSERAPKAIAIIMDGNRRYARAGGLSSLEGHMAGYEKLKEVLAWTQEAGVRHLTVYAFSTENWKRTPEEVEGLMNLFRLLTRELESSADTRVRIRFLGDINAFPEDLKISMQHIERTTEAYGPCTLAIAASYGGRQEIVRAAEVLMREGGELTEARFASALDTSGMPDPDIIIRTGGEQRLSNFLLWQSAYSELFFLETHWPALSRADFDGVLAEYAARERRFGA